MVKSMRNIFCGDIHGELRQLAFEVGVRRGIRDANVIVLGDFGVGFGRPHSMEHQYERVRKRLEKYNLIIWTVRGNHDDPEWFDGTHDFERLHFLPDYSITNIGGYSVYAIGGAISTDRKWRLEKQKKMKTRIWWPEEGVVKKDDGFPTKVDVIISHTAPIQFAPIPSRYDDMDLDLFEEILEERRYLGTLVQEINWKRWFYGHFHEHNYWGMADKIATGLGIMELLEIPEKEEGD